MDEQEFTNRSGRIMHMNELANVNQKKGNIKNLEFEI